MLACGEHHYDFNVGDFLPQLIEFARQVGLKSGCSLANKYGDSWVKKNDQVSFGERNEVYNVVVVFMVVHDGSIVVELVGWPNIQTSTITGGSTL